MDTRVREGRAAAARRTRPLVLVVDDDAASRTLLRELVLLEGCDVIEAADGSEALAACEAHRPDMVLLDVLMPGMDGPDVARRLRRRSEEDAIVPIIFVTAVDDEAQLAECLAAGGDDFLVKPYSRAVLAAKLRAWMRTRELHEEVRRQRDALAAHKRRRDYEDELAKSVFARLVARGEEDPPNLRRLQVPAAEFCGDLVLAARTPDGRQRLLVGDFTGHGLPAALGAVPTADIFYAMTAKGFPLAAVADTIDRRLRQGLGPCMFLAAALIEISPELELVRALNAGLPDVLVLHTEEGRLWRVPADEPPLGVAGVERAWEPRRWRLDPAERIFVYSDGLLEAPLRDGGGTLGEEGLEALLLAHGAGDTVAALRARLCLDCPEGVSDDVTFVELGCAGLTVPVRGPRRAPAAADRGRWRVELEVGPELLRHGDPVLALMAFLDEAHALGPHRDALFVVLRELVANALEHGLLGLDSAAKADAEGFAAYYAERDRRLGALREGSIRLRLEHEPRADGGAFRLTVEDTGPGFDIDRLARADAPATAAHGRGLALVRALCERLEHRGRGNVAEAVYAWQAEPEE